MFGDVTSANVVGYQSFTVQGTDATGKVKYYMIGFQFKGVQEGQDRIKLGDAINMGDIPAFSGAWRENAKAPMVQIHNGAAYDVYYYFKAGTSGLKEVLTKDSWVDKNKYIANDVYVDLGRSFWFSDKGLGTETGTLTLAGSVKTEATAPIVLTGADIQMLANPFPMSVSVDSIGCTLTPFSGAWRENAKAPQIQVYNGSAYDVYYWFKAGTTGLKDVLTKDSWVNKNKYIATNDILESGEGFWLVNKNNEAGTLTFNYAQ